MADKVAVKDIDFYVQSKGLCRTNHNKAAVCGWQSRHIYATLSGSYWWWHFSGASANPMVIR